VLFAAKLKAASGLGPCSKSLKIPKNFASALVWGSCTIEENAFEKVQVIVGYLLMVFHPG